MVEPIKPKDIKRVFPDEVIAAFNDVIVENWDGEESRFKQEVVVTKISNNMRADRSVIFENHYLDVEPVYESVGWLVEYDKPGFNEEYEATFTFKPKRSRRQGTGLY